MGCAASKPSREGLDGNAHGEDWQKGSTSPTTPLPKLLAGQSAAAAEEQNQADTPTTSDSSTYSHSSQLSTWDMRTMQGPITTTTTASAKKPAPAAPPTKPAAAIEQTQPPATMSGRLSPSFAALQISLPSFSQRMRSPSILGTPALDTPLAPAPASPTERLVVTKIGGCTLVNQYLVVQYLGRGTSGKVYLCIDVLDRRLYAVKIVRKTPREEKKEGKEEESGDGGEEEVVKEKTVNASNADGTDKRTDAVDNDDKAVLQKKEEEKDDHSEHSDKFALKAERMKEKAALRNKNTPTPTKKSNSLSPSTNKLNNSTSSSSTSRRNKIKNIRDPLLDLRREVEILRSVGNNNPNIVALREIVDDPTSNKMLIVMEYCEGGPVMTRAGLERGRRIPECVARPYFRDMITALGHLHKNRVIHGDLKPENALMCANGRIALSDFGCSKILLDDNPKNDRVDRCNGTPAFLAPEMMVAGANFRGRPADVYALGACLFTFIFGRIPFTAESVAELFKIVKTQELEFPDVPADASVEVKALLWGLLAKDPEKRMTLEKAAKHRWTTDNGRLPAVSLSVAKEESKNKVISNFSVEDPHIRDGDVSLAGLLSCSGVEVVTFLSGEVLLRQGDRSTNMMYILQGHVDVLYRPSEEVLQGAQKGTNNTTTNLLEKREGEEAAAEKLSRENQKSGGGSGISSAITKLWSPSARLKRSARDTSSSSPINAIPALDLTRATRSTSAASSLPPLPPQMLSARSTGTGTGTTPRLPLNNSTTTTPSASLVSPRERSLMLGLGNTPEPSPRFPLHSSTGAISTGALSTSNFQISQGLGAAGGGNGVGSHALDSAVTTPRNDTPAITPLHSARGSGNGNEGFGGGGAAPQNLLLPSTDAVDGDVDDVDQIDGKEREPTPFFTPLPGSSTTTIDPSKSIVDNNKIQNFVTPGNELHSLSPSLATRVEVTPGSSGGGGGGSTLSAYPLELSSIGLPRPDSGSSWAPQLSPGGDFSTQTTFHIEQRDTATTTVVDNIPCALAEAAEEAGGFIKSLYRDTHTYTITNTSTTSTSGDGTIRTNTKSSTPTTDGTIRTNSTNNSTIRTGGEYLLAVRGPGDFIGETALIGGSSVRRSCSIRASSTYPGTSAVNNNGVQKNMNTSQLLNNNNLTAPVNAGAPMTPSPNENNTADSSTDDINTSISGVQVAVIPYSVAKEYLKQHPLAKQRLAEMVWSRQSETIVLEGLLRLAGISKELHEEARKHLSV